MEATAATRRFRLDPVWITFVGAAAIWLFSLIRVEGYRSLEYNLFTLRVAPFSAIVAAGQTLVVLMGGIDLSVAAVVTMAGVIGGNLITQIGEPGGIIVTLILAAMVGVSNGLGVVLLRLPPLVMTLASLSVIQGVLLVYNAGKPVSGESDVSELLGAWQPARFQPRFGCSPRSQSLHRAAPQDRLWPRHLRDRQQPARGAPLRHAVGLTQIATYALCSVFAGITGLLILGRTGYSSKTAGDPYLLMSIAAVVIGGTSILGGRGKLIGTIGGALVLTVLINVLTVENIPEAGRMIIQGGLILILLIAYASSEP